jgi:hypothetical protein
LHTLALESDRVDHDDVRRSRVLGALDRVGPDPAGAEDRDRLARPHARRVDGGAPPGRHAAAGQRGHLEGDVGVDRHAGVLRHHRALGERAEHAEAAEVGAVIVVEAKAAVRQHPGHHLGAPVAQVLVAGRAVPADPAGGDERADHVVADVDAGHAGPDRLDHAGPLVAADHRQPAA